MLRGFLSGILWGGVVVLVVTGFASLLAPLPATVDPQQSAAETTTGSDKEGSGDIGSTSQADSALEEGSNVAVATPGGEDAAPLADTESAPQPQTETPDVSLNAPEAGENGGELSGAGSDAPVMTSPSAPTPDAPDAPELAPDSIATNPAQPMAPPVTEESAFAPQAEPEITEDSEQADMSPAAEADEAVAQTESLLKPTGDLKEKFPQLDSSRLPTVSDDTEENAAPAPLPPFEANAVAFEAAGDKPLMSIVLIDDGAPEFAPEALADFPYPLSIAINTLAPDVTERVATYRNMGFEVLAMVDLPASAAPTDVEVALEVHLEVMPEAVAVMEGIGDGLQGSKPLSDQVTAVLQSSGHGLVMFQKGLDTARKLASREGVPAATVFRDFDGKGQSASVIRRFLDQAAFKADQEGGVIMVGRLREETLSALLVWGLQDRAGSVALAPISTVIAAKQP
ncbi:divergent polysaccharide deacteylase family protein [Shimia sediminis]|uniref:divergent polysaccharide deacteylase family protein n=1 Tax=Shimia sediminis TaxID=2497945 RepID=UPI000F8CBF7C|nr:divergent polysaccharide deacetylase family protein [Shimia sediminis]